MKNVEQKASWSIIILSAFAIFIATILVNTAAAYVAAFLSIIVLCVMVWLMGIRDET